MINDIIGNLCTVCTIGLFLTGIQTSHKIVQKGNTNDIASLPFVSMFTNCILWFMYGYLINNIQIMVVNAVGLTLGTAYTITYVYFTQHKKKMLHQIAFICIFISTVFCYAFYYEDNTTASSSTVGLLASSASVIMFGSPLGSLKTVIATQSTETLSFPLCIANFVVSTEWFIYGILLHDYFVQIPNLLGAILGFAQVSLFCKYPSQSIATKSKLKDDEISVTLN